MHINLTAPINFRSYGLVGFNLCKELNELGCNIALWPIGQIEAEPQSHDLIRGLIANQDDYSYWAPSVRLFHQFDLAQHVGNGVHFGFPIFELDSFNPRELKHLRNQDEIIVCSKWAKEVILNNSICPDEDHVSVVPLGVDSTIFYPIDKSTSTTTKFFNAGKLEYRKGHDVLVEMFNYAFTQKDDVELHLLWNNPFITENEIKTWEDFYKRTPLGNKIFFHPWMETQKEVAAWMNSMDCGVFPSRAEGWNLELLECLACGKHAIATNYSGHTEFIDQNNCMLIQTNQTEVAYDGKWFVSDIGKWAVVEEDQIEQTVNHMRNFHNSEKCMNNAGVNTAKRFTWNNTAQQLMKTLQGAYAI